MREYFYEIDLEGRLAHDGSVLTDHAFLDFFFKRLHANDTGRHSDFPYLSPCGKELNFVRARDTAIVFRSLTGDGRLGYAADLTVAFDPEELRFSEGGALYHAAPVGSFGRMSSRLMTELAPRLERFGPFYSLRMPESNQREVVVLPLEAAVGEPERSVQLLRPRAGNGCFGCGPAHGRGPALSFLYRAEEQTAVTYLTPTADLQGAPGWMHGGFVSLLLDEVMGKVLSGMGVRAPTANLHVNFRSPVRLGRRLAVFARTVAGQGRKHRLAAQMLDIAETDGERPERDGRLLAEAEGLFISPRDPMPQA